MKNIFTFFLFFLFNIIFFAVASYAQNTENETEDTSETTENLGTKKQENIIIIDTANSDWSNKKEPVKSSKNLIRIKFPKDEIKLSDTDKIAITSALKLINDEKIKNITVISHSSKRGDVIKEREHALLRALEVREFLTTTKIKSDEISYQVHEFNAKNTNLDYIDIDKN